MKQVGKKRGEMLEATRSKQSSRLFFSHPYNFSKSIDLHKNRKEVIANMTMCIFNKPALGHAGYTNIRPLAFLRTDEDAHIPL